jgi:hypothetical protein
MLPAKMRYHLLFTAIYVFNALVVAVPFPQSVIKVIIETQSVIDRQVYASAPFSLLPSAELTVHKQRPNSRKHHSPADSSQRHQSSGS